MRLINTATLMLEEFIDGKNCPKYAILSHRWLREEVTFKDSQDVSRMERKPESLQKLRNACALAKSRGHAYIWIDTCCIDKSSSAELSEAISSMFAWYRAAQAC